MCDLIGYTSLCGSMSFSAIVKVIKMAHLVATRGNEQYFAVLSAVQLSRNTLFVGRVASTDCCASLDANARRSPTLLDGRASATHETNGVDNFNRLWCCTMLLNLASQASLGSLS